MRNGDLSHRVLSRIKRAISFPSNRHVLPTRVHVLRGTESCATITSIWTIERDLSRIPVDDSPIVRLPYWRSLTILPTLRTTSRYPRSLPVGKKCRRDGETDFRYCASYFSPFLLIPRTRSRGPGKLGARRRSTRESLRPFVKEEMTIVLSLRDYRCYRQPCLADTKTHEFTANLSSREPHFPLFHQSTRPSCIRDDYSSLSPSRGSPTSTEFLSSNTKLQ